MALGNLIQRFQAKYGVVGPEQSHAEQAARLATQLFDGLKDVHGLEPESRRLLQEGALLHEAGLYLGAARHHRTGRYLILHDSLFDVAPPRWRTAVGFLARNHRRTPSRMRGVPAADRKEILVLSALLRVACGLDRARGQRVKRVAITVFPNLVILRLHGDGPLHLDTGGGLRKTDLLEEVTGRKVKIVAAGPAPGRGAT